MKNFPFLIFLLFLLSCTSKRQNPDLIGKWHYIDNEEYFLNVTDDSFIIQSVYETKQNWTSDQLNIHFTNITDKDMNLLDSNQFRNHFIYSLSDNKDTLVWSAKNDPKNRNYKFLKEK